VLCEQETKNGIFDMAGRQNHCVIWAALLGLKTEQEKLRHRTNVHPRKEDDIQGGIKREELWTAENEPQLRNRCPDLEQHKSRPTTLRQDVKAYFSLNFKHRFTSETRMLPFSLPLLIIRMKI
jgi:hypothetical protein